MASALHEPITRIWGQSSQQGPGQSPWSAGQGGGTNPPEAEDTLFRCPNDGEICLASLTGIERTTTLRDSNPGPFFQSLVSGLRNFWSANTRLPQRWLRIVTCVLWLWLLMCGRTDLGGGIRWFCIPLNPHLRCKCEDQNEDIQTLWHVKLRLHQLSFQRWRCYLLPSLPSSRRLHRPVYQPSEHHSARQQIWSINQLINQSINE